MAVVTREQVAEALRSYAIGDQIGRGATGVVFAATHRQLGREVAVKALYPQLSADPDAKRRFLDEAKLLASFNHTHIVPIYDFVEQDDLCLLVMERLPGGTLNERPPSGPGSGRLACALALAVCSALHYAHGSGVLHRDVKPQNSLFSGDDTLKVTDFGIAKVLGDTSGATRTGFVLGTPGYMAPEQAQGQPVTPATDVYAVGVLAYWMLSGRHPFPVGGDPLEVLYQRVHTDPIPLQSANPDIHAALTACVMRALERNPADRYQSAEAFGVAIAEAAADAWGPSWLAATGAVVVPAGAIAEAIHRAGSVAIEPTIGVPAPGDGSAAGATAPPAAEEPSEGPPADPEGGAAPPAPPATRRRRTLVAVVAAALAAAVVAAVAAIVVGGGDEGHAPASRAASGPSVRAASAWRTLPPAPTARQQAAAAVVGGEIWLAGGLRPGPHATPRVEALDPAIDSWKTGPSLPVPLHHVAGVAYRGHLVLVGGWVPVGPELDAQTSGRVLELRGQRWTSLPSLKHPRAAAGAAVADGRVVVVGGQAEHRLVRPTEVFDGHRWTDGAPIPTPREHLAAVSDGRYVYAIGGRVLSSSRNLATLERYDPVANRWQKLPAMPTARGGLGAAVIGGNLVAVGGEAPTSALRTVESYNFRSRRWSRLAPLPAGVHGEAVVAIGRTLYVLAGGRSPGHASSTAIAEALELRTARTRARAPGS